ncbi:HNH endonuclease [Pseudomonas tussilaginis]|uniref:HNH endonuclease n=1 Tax=Pseudomonas sp. 5 TaxID=1619949 RepID=UPI0009E43FC4|nr:HNH endonuclease domain-containing protein [Pseudomonas sp. 5]
MIKSELECPLTRRKEVQNFLNSSYGVKKHIAKTTELLTLWAAKSLKERVDHWDTLSNFYHKVDGESAITGSAIKSAFRDHLAPEQQFRCCYCRRLLLNHGTAKPIDHILPKETYPQFSLYYWNLAICCTDCNRKKGRTVWGALDSGVLHYPKPTDASNFYHPRFHIYDLHVRFFRIETNGLALSIYKGLTPQGEHLCSQLLSAVSAKEALHSTNEFLSPSLIKLESFLGKAEDFNLQHFSKFMDLLDHSIEAGMS